jgi:hypothetical protein
VAGSFCAKEHLLLHSLENFWGFSVDFGSDWSGLDLIIIIFPKSTVLLQFSKRTGTAG